MTTSKSIFGCSKTVNYHAEVPFLRIPKIKGSKTIDGIKYYIGEKGKMYLSSLFDKMFKRNN